MVLILHCPKEIKASKSKNHQGTKKWKHRKKMPPAVDSKIYSTWLATCQRINACSETWERWTRTSAWRAACSRLLRVLSDNSQNTELKSYRLASLPTFMERDFVLDLQVHISTSVLCTCIQQQFIFLKKTVFVQWIFIEYLSWDRHSVIQ